MPSLHDGMLKLPNFVVRNWIIGVATTVTLVMAGAIGLSNGHRVNGDSNILVKAAANVVPGVSEADVGTNPSIEPEFLSNIADPTLPRVLIIGDSVSIGYTLPVRQSLSGRANVLHIPENGLNSRYGLARMERWLGLGERDRIYSNMGRFDMRLDEGAIDIQVGKRLWDVILFNFGLHDVRIVDEEPAIPIEEYASNVSRILSIIQATNARVIWATITPVPEGELYGPRNNDDVVNYNNAAMKIMKGRKVQVCDLYSYALPQLPTIQRPLNAHFTLEGYQTLSSEVAYCINRALDKLAG